MNRYRAAIFAAGLMLLVGGCASSPSSIPFTNIPLPPAEPGPTRAYPSLRATPQPPADTKPVLNDDQQKQLETDLQKAAAEREQKVKQDLERDKN